MFGLNVSTHHIYTVASGRTALGQLPLYLYVHDVPHSDTLEFRSTRTHHYSQLFSGIDTIFSIEIARIRTLLTGGASFGLDMPLNIPGILVPFQLLLHPRLVIPTLIVKGMYE